MKKALIFLITFTVMLCAVTAVTCFAKEAYTVSVAVEYDFDPDVEYFGINQDAENVVFDKLEGLGANGFVVDCDPEDNSEIITGIFDKPIDVKKVEECLARVPGFELRDSEGNVLLDETDLYNAAELYRVGWDDYEEKNIYVNVDENGNISFDTFDEHPGITSMLRLYFTDEGEVKLNEALSEIAGREEGKNRFYIYINDKLVVSYEAAEDCDYNSLTYIGESDKENAVLSFSIRVDGKYIMPKSTKVVKMGGPYTINCSEWGFSSVLFMIANEVIDIEDDIDYTKPVTREEFCTYAAKIIIGQAVDFIDVNDYTSTFKDTKNREVALLNSLGIINGKGNGIFAPDDFITREEASAILYRMCKYLMGEKFNPDTSDFKYSDHDEISSWATESVYLCLAGDIMKGVGDENFDPDGIFTREQSFITFDRIAMKTVEVELWEDME